MTDLFIHFIFILHTKPVKNHKTPFLAPTWDVQATQLLTQPKPICQSIYFDNNNSNAFSGSSSHATDISLCSFSIFSLPFLLLLLLLLLILPPPSPAPSPLLLDFCVSQFFDLLHHLFLLFSFLILFQLLPLLSSFKQIYKIFKKT